MANPNDFDWVYKDICAICLGGGTIVEMESLDDVGAGDKRECPTCQGTWFLTTKEGQKKSE
jgi:hypothetical protein